MSFLTPTASSINGSYYTPDEDTFFQTRRRISFSNRGTLNSSTPVGSAHFTPSPRKPVPAMSPSKSAGIPNTPIKPLLASPFKVPQSTKPLISSTPLAGPNTPVKGPMSPLLRKKFQQQLPGTPQPSEKQSPQSINSNIYQRSIFKPRHKSPLKESSNLPTTEKPAPVESKDESELQSPYVELALSRIVNRDAEIRTVIINTLMMLLYRFLVAVIVLLNVKFRLRDGTSLFPAVLSQYSSYVNRTVYGILLFNIGVSSLRLMKPQDKCLDLPLTSRQRKLLGLPLVNGMDVQEELEVDRSEQNILPSSPTKDIADTSLLALDISRSFANMNISQTDKSPVTLVSETPQERIRKQLLSRDNGPASPQARFKKPSSKFLYDTASAGGFDINNSDVSFY
ncbi:hypothetical protein KL936_004955 [Ogataea polymorpha]|nr:hypothetical protein KL936_004955 [Ogataea polymorpha]